MSIRQTIKRVLKEDTKQEVLDFIDEFGISRAVSFFGGDVLKDILGNDLTKEVILKTIRNFVEENDYWVNLNQHGDEFLYKVTENGEESIEYLTSDGVIVVIYEKQGDDWEVIDEYVIWYEDLSDDIFDKIFNLIIKYKTKWG